MTLIIRRPGRHDLFTAPFTVKRPITMAGQEKTKEELIDDLRELRDLIKRLEVLQTLLIKFSPMGIYCVTLRNG